MATSNILGPHDIDTWRLASYVEPIPWYWELGQGMILENPMVNFAISIYGKIDDCFSLFLQPLPRGPFLLRLCYP